MDTKHAGLGGARRTGAILLPVLLALLTAYAPAGTFADSVDDANANALLTGPGSYTDVETITIGTDQTLTANDSQFGGWRIHGTTTPADPSAGVVYGFDNVTLNGAAGKTTLDGAGRNSTVLSVLHANNIAINRLIITGGNYSAANVGGYSEVAGGGLLLGGNGFASNTYRAPESINVSDSTITGNTLTITAGTTTDNLFGAGVAVNGTGNLDTTYTSAVTFSNVDITGNTLSYVRGPMAADQDASIRGGGGRIGYAQSFTYTGGTVSGNEVRMTGGDHAAGGGLSIDGAGTYQDVGTTKAVSINNVLFSDNSVAKNGDTHTQESYARGGGFYYYNGTNPLNPATVAFENGTAFDNNSATANSSSTYNANAEGGAAFVMLDNTTVVVDGATFTDNSATSSKGRGAGGAIMADLANAGTVNVGSLDIDGSSFDGNSATGTTAAYGGAVAANYGSHTIDNSSFTDNTATASAFNGRALGGAVYFAKGGNTVTKLEASGNKADGTYYAKGGGMYLGSGTNTVKDSTIDGNIADSDTYAQGGGIFAESGVLNVVNSSITNNRVVVESSTTGAKGSAIYMDTATNVAGVTKSIINLEATAATDKTVIEGNKTNGDHRVSGIHFGNSEGGSSRYSAELNISGAGEVVLRNPVTATMDNGKAFTMTKSGSGTLTWDGWNEFDVGGGVLVSLNDGRINLGKDFTAKATSGTSNYTVEILSSVGSDPVEVWFDTARDETLAMFDFSNSGAKDFDVETGTKLVASVGRQVKSSEKEYVVASGLDETTLNQLASDFDYVTDGSGYLYIDNKLTVNGNKLIAGVNFRSPFDRNANSLVAQDALESLVQGDWGVANISDAEYNAMLRNARNVTPELFMEQTYVMLDGVDRVSRSAMDFGLRYPHRARVKEEGEYMSNEDMIDAYGHAGAYSHYAYPSLAGDYCEPSGGFRLWTGYVGDWRNMDAHGGYNGYRMDRNGMIAGLNYDFGTMASVGIYGGYTKSNTKAQNADSKVRSDVGHLGLQARWSPLTADRGLSFFVDGGYHWSANDITRNLGGWNAGGSFDQDVITIGGGIEYVAELECLTIIPHIEGRYFNIDQHGMQESGSSATITHIAGVDKSTFNTRVGVELTRDYMLGCVTFSPALNIDWRHEWGGKQAAAAASFVNDPFPVPFFVSASRQDKDSLDLGFSLKTYRNFGTSQIGFNVAYNLNVSKNSDTHSVYAGMEYGF